MKHITSKLLSLLLCLAMLMSMVPAAYAAGTEGSSKVVAKVGQTSYATLDDALAAAEDGNTVTLLADTKEDVTINKNITLDLGGKTLTNTNASKATLTVAAGATATVMNGNIVGGTSFYTIQNNGTATFKDVTATAGNNDSSMIDNYGDLTINSGSYTGGQDTIKNEPNAKLTITGGTFTLEEGTSRGFTGVVFNYGTLSISGGEFIQSDKDAPYGQAQVIYTDKNGNAVPSTIITGGSFTNNCTRSAAWTVREANAAAGCTEVKGGTFNKKVSDDYCADGFIPTKNADGTYGVKEGKYVAQIGDKKYETLADAIRLAAKGKTVKLLNDVDLDKTIAVSGKTITLDMNGHMIYNTNDLWDKPTEADQNWSLISVRGNSNLTITGNGTLKAKKDDCYAIDVQDKNAVLTVENGKVVGNIHAVYVTEGTAYIKGGTYSIQQKYPIEEKANEFVLNLYDASGRDGTAKIVVTGGTFEKFNPANCQAEGEGTNFCAPGYKTELTNGVYVVKAGTNDAMELVDTALKTQETDDVKNALEAVSQIPNSTLADNSSVMEKLGQLDETLKSGSITVNPNNKSTNVTLSEVKNAALSADTDNTADQTITITVKDDSTAKTDVAQSAVAGATDAKGLDITMTKTVENGEPTTIDKPTAPVVLTFTLPEGWKNAQIVYVDENNQPEMVKTTVNGDKVTGVFNHFSQYILVKTAEAQNPNAYEIILTPNRMDVCAGDTLSYTISLKHTAGDGALGMFTFVPDITSGLLTNGTFVAETGVNAEYGPDSKTNKDKLVIRDLDLATGQTLKIGTLKYTVDAYGIDGTQVRYTRNSKGVVTNQGYSKEASVSLLNEQDVTYHLSKVTFQPFTGAATEGYAVYGTNEIYATLNDLKTRNAEAKVTAPALSTATTGGTVYRVLDDQWHLSTDENQTFALSGGIKTSVTFVEKYVKLVNVTIPKNASNKDLVEITETITRKNGEDSYVDYGTALKFKLTTNAKADAGKKYVVKVKVGDGKAFAPTGPDASDIYTVEASKITGDVSFELSQEMNLTADDIGIFIDTDTTNHTTSYRNYSVYSGERTLVLIKGDKKAKYQFSDTAAQHPTIYKTGAQYEGYNFGVLIDPTSVEMTQEAMLNYLVNTLGLHIVTDTATVNPTITYNYETAGLHGGEALVDAQITRDFSELAAGNKWHWAPSDDLLLKADVITVGNGDKYNRNDYIGKADGHVSTDDVNTFMYLHVGMPKINP